MFDNKLILKAMDFIGFYTIVHCFILVIILTIGILKHFNVKDKKRLYKIFINFFEGSIPFILFLIVFMLSSSKINLPFPVLSVILFFIIYISIITLKNIIKTVFKKDF